MQNRTRIINKWNLFKKKPQKEEEEEEDETEDTNEFRVERSSPLVRTKDFHDGRVQVEIFIPGLEPGRAKHRPKGGRIKFDFFNNGLAFDMHAEFVDKTKKVKTIYHFRVKQLPGKVDTDESKWEVVKGKILVTMEKHLDDRNIDWQPAVWSRGLDQLSSSSSDDD